MKDVASNYRFSFVAPCLLDGNTVIKKNDVPQKPLCTSSNNFFEEYELLNILGTGSYSVCRLARHRTTGQQYAVKVILLHTVKIAFFRDIGF